MGWGEGDLLSLWLCDVDGTASGDGICCALICNNTTLLLIIITLLYAYRNALIYLHYSTI